MSWRPMKASFSIILLPPTTRLQQKVATLGATRATPCERFKRPSDVEPVSITVANATLRSAAGSPLPGPPGDGGMPLSRGSLTEGFLDRLFWSLLTGISILPAFQGDTHARKDRMRVSSGRAGGVSRGSSRADQSRVSSGGWWPRRAASHERREAPPKKVKSR